MHMAAMNTRVPIARTGPRSFAGSIRRGFSFTTDRHPTRRRRRVSIAGALGAEERSVPGVDQWARRRRRVSIAGAPGAEERSEPGVDQWARRRRRVSIAGALGA